MRYPVDSNDAPKAIGPYSQGIKAGGFVFVSGQVALDPKTGEMVGSDVAAQTERVLQNLRAIVEAAGSDLDRVVKATVYLRTMADFAAMNQVYAKYFKSEPPSRATVAVAGLPKDALVEIDVIAEV
jgi:2-iminobutanoate/2-iminopropanoate deaminase